jgi:putative transcriptional regulator
MNLVGNLLIAPPAVKNNFWHKTVVLVTEHHANGSLGLVLNKRSELSVRDFGKQLGVDLDMPGFLYIGGPINVQSLSFLHSTEWSSKNTMQLGQHFRISSAEDIIPRLVMGDRPARGRLFLGMCGWAPNQLIDEMRGKPPRSHKDSWCLATADLDIVFNSDDKEQWCNAVDRSGQEFAKNLLT